MAIKPEDSRDSLYRKLMQMTTRITTHDESGNVYHGTGFFFAFIKDETTFTPVIVTCAHLIEDAVKVEFQFRHLFDAKSNKEGIGTVKLDDDDLDSWIYHPNDDIDLCIIPISFLLKNPKVKELVIVKTTYIRSDQILQNYECDIVENILMLGYPEGIWDSYNLLPVVRKGITATPPLLKFENNREFLVDIAAHTGSSGSPVFIPYDLMSENLSENTTHGALLAGILSAGRLSSVTKRNDDQSIDQDDNLLFPNNIGVAISADVLLDFLPIIEKGKKV